jgi:hypothetical protein
VREIPCQQGKKSNPHREAIWFMAKKSSLLDIYTSVWPASANAEQGIVRAEKRSGREMAGEFCGVAVSLL